MLSLDCEAQLSTTPSGYGIGSTNSFQRNEITNSREATRKQASFAELIADLRSSARSVGMAKMPVGVQVVVSLSES